MTARIAKRVTARSRARVSVLRAHLGADVGRQSRRRAPKALCASGLLTATPASRCSEQLELFRLALACGSSALRGRACALALPWTPSLGSGGRTATTSRLWSLRRTLRTARLGALQPTLGQRAPHVLLHVLADDCREIIDEALHTSHDLISMLLGVRASHAQAHLPSSAGGQELRRPGAAATPIRRSIARLRSRTPFLAGQSFVLAIGQCRSPTTRSHQEQIDVSAGQTWRGSSLTSTHGRPSRHEGGESRVPPLACAFRSCQTAPCGATWMRVGSPIC